MYSIEYKSYTIYARPCMQVVTGYWKTRLTIKDYAHAKIFDDKNVFSTEAEAVFYSIKYGKKLIDEGIKLD